MTREGDRRVGPALIVPLMALWLACAPGPNAGAEATASTAEPELGVPRRLRVRVETTYPHDPEAWTQGLLWYDGWLYESVGLYGRSALRRVDVRRGTVEHETRLADNQFGEGLARVRENLYQLTWRSGVGLRYDLGTLEPRGEFRYQGQGWGLCWSGRELIRSDGSHRLFHHDPGDFRLLRTVEVSRQGTPQRLLNELECADGWVYANVLGSDEIVRIDSDSGVVSAVIDASGLLSPEERAAADVLNGIAHRPATGSFLITGKYWPKLFEVVFVEAR